MKTDRQFKFNEIGSDAELEESLLEKTQSISGAIRDEEKSQ